MRHEKDARPLLKVCWDLLLRLQRRKGEVLRAPLDCLIGVTSLPTVQMPLALQQTLRHAPCVVCVKSGGGCKGTFSSLKDVQYSMI